MRPAEQKVYSMGIELRERSDLTFRIHLLNLIHILIRFKCQMINNLIFQIDTYHIVALIDG